MSEDYSGLKGYEVDADLGVGCGLPTEYAGIREGNTVLDLGSGAGNDCFIARAEVGETGKIIGIDFSPQMIEKARKNATKRRYSNVEFIEGDIENMPLPDSSIDVVVSNCVLNLLPEKNKIFKEIYRVSKHACCGLYEFSALSSPKPISLFMILSISTKSTPFPQSKPFNLPT
ncbi:MAG: methyltransferase domain-containing protein [Massilibacteroides sp.]|nr:methyltransferase domain-containing protein [Massilibacteroides sp.]MDD4514632.1 methyltransferase domain-containing protein [Massilibacteroides sp.]